MSEQHEYDPGDYDRSPHCLYECECGNTAIVVGWAYDTVRCTKCSQFMVWSKNLYDPRTPGGESHGD